MREVPAEQARKRSQVAAERQWPGVISLIPDMKIIELLIKRETKKDKVGKRASRRALTTSSLPAFGAQSMFILLSRYAATAAGGIQTRNQAARPQISAHQQIPLSCCV